MIISYRILVDGTLELLPVGWHIKIDMSFLEHTNCLCLTTMQFRLSFNMHMHVNSTDRRSEAKKRSYTLYCLPRFTYRARAAAGYHGYGTRVSNARKY